jgi:hypothetical protein
VWVCFFVFYGNVVFFLVATLLLLQQVSFTECFSFLEWYIYMRVDSCVDDLG